MDEPPKAPHADEALRVVDPGAPILRMPKDRPRIQTDHANDFSKAYCFHNRVSVDDSRRRVFCGECKVELDPIDVLCRYAREESRLTYATAASNKLLEVVAAKTRFQYAHCRRYTRFDGERNLAINADGQRVEPGAAP